MPGTVLSLDTPSQLRNKADRGSAVTPPLQTRKEPQAEGPTSRGAQLVSPQRVLDPSWPGRQAPETVTAAHTLCCGAKTGERACQTRPDRSQMKRWWPRRLGGEVPRAPEAMCLPPFGGLERIPSWSPPSKALPPCIPRFPLCKPPSADEISGCHSQMLL